MKKMRDFRRSSRNNDVLSKFKYGVIMNYKLAHFGIFHSISFMGDITDKISSNNIDCVVTHTGC